MDKTTASSPRKRSEIQCDFFSSDREGVSMHEPGTKIFCTVRWARRKDVDLPPGLRSLFGIQI